MTRSLVHNAAIAALAGMMVSGDVPLSYGAPEVKPAPPRYKRPSSVDEARLVAAQAKRERKRQKRLADAMLAERNK